MAAETVKELEEIRSQILQICENGQTGGDPVGYEQIRHLLINSKLGKPKVWRSCYCHGGEWHEATFGCNCCDMAGYAAAVEKPK